MANNDSKAFYFYKNFCETVKALRGNEHMVYELFEKLAAFETGDVYEIEDPIVKAIWAGWEPMLGTPASNDGKEKRSEAAKKAANARWGNNASDASSDAADANAYATDANAYAADANAYAADANAYAVNAVDASLQDKRKENNNKSKENNNNNSPAPSASPSVLEREFESIWAEYPRRQERKDAFAAYCSARKQGTTAEQIAKGVRAYCAYIERNRVDPKYIKQGGTFFRQQGWSDDWSGSFQTARSGTPVSGSGQEFPQRTDDLDALALQLQFAASQ